MFIFIYISWDILVKRQKNYKESLRKPHKRPRKQKRTSDTYDIQEEDFDSENTVSEGQFFTNRENFEKLTKKQKKRGKSP